MEADRHPTPPIQELHRAQESHQVLHLEKDQPLFIPEDDCTFLIYHSFCLFSFNPLDLEQPSLRSKA